MRTSGQGAGRREPALAVVSGVMMGAAFLPAPIGFVAWFALVPLLEAISCRVSAGASGGALFRLGWTFGFTFYLIGTHWIALLSDVAITVPWLKYPAWIVASGYLALFSGLAAWLTGALSRRAGVPVAAVFPFAYLGTEELRASGEMGFPWFQPGYSQHEYAPVIQLASLGSVSLVTLWLLILNVMIWQALRRRSRLRVALGAAFALLLPWLWGLRVLEAAPQRPGPAVALVQGNIPGDIKWSGRHQAEILERFISLSRRAARDSLGPQVIVWPETATGSYMRQKVDQRLAVLRLAAETGVPVFSGFADYGFDEGGNVAYYNAAGLFLPDGSTSTVYAKRHLVPFGERMPFQWLAPGLGKIELGQAEWTPGPEAVLFPGPAGPFTCLVCFEAIFPGLVRDDVRRGARWLVNITNDEWFGNSAALYQHAAMAVFRAVENRVPLARCANTGLTVLVDSNGRIEHRSPVFEPAVLSARLSAPGPTTPYTRFGDWPGYLSGLMIAWFAASPLLRSLTTRAGRD